MSGALRWALALGRAGMVLLMGTALLGSIACRKDSMARCRRDRSTLAVVGRYAVSAKDFEEALRENVSGPESQAALKSRIWDRFLEEVLVLNDVYDTGAAAGEVIPLQSLGTAQQRREAVDLRLQREVYAKVSITDADVAKAYKGHSEEFRKGRGYLLRQITVGDKARAQEARALLASGKSFDEVARKFSATPKSGAPEYFEDAELPEYLAAALKGLRPGLPSPPLSVAAETWQIVRIEKRPESYILPFDLAAASIRLRLTDERESALYRQYMAALRSRFRIQEFPWKFTFAYQKEPA